MGWLQIAVHGQGAEQAQAEAALASLTSDRPRVRRRDKLNPTRREAALREEAAQSAVQAWLGGQKLGSGQTQGQVPSSSIACFRRVVE